MIVTVEQPHTDTDTDTASRSADTAPTDTDTAPRSADKKIERLNTASLRRVIEPDTEVTGAVGEGQVIPSEMLTVADLGLDLSDRERATLSREELASVVISGIRFETFLMSGFAAQMACTADPKPIPGSFTCCTRWARKPGTPGCSYAWSTNCNPKPPTHCRPASARRSFGACSVRCSIDRRSSASWCWRGRRFPISSRRRSLTIPRPTPLSGT